MKDEFTPISLQEAKDCLEHDTDPTLMGMIRNGTPLTRSAYITRSYDAEQMFDWDYEKEQSLPECFQDKKICDEMIAASKKIRGEA